MYTYYLRFGSIRLVLILTMICVVGCDSPDLHLTSEGQPVGRTESYIYSDGTTLSVILDQSSRPQTRRFTSMDEFHLYLEDLISKGSIQVNDENWALLKHGNDPAEVSVLDDQRSVIIDESVYTLEVDGVYRHPVGAPESGRVLEFYYGQSGQEDLVEFTLASRAVNGIDLSEIDFKNDFARELVQWADDFLAAEQAIRADKADETSALGAAVCDSAQAGPNSTDFRYCYADHSTLFPNGTSHLLPAGYDRSPGNYDVRVMMLNQSYRKGFKKKAYGVTGTSIRKHGSGDSYFGLVSENCPTYTDVRWLGSIEVEESGYYFNVGVKVEGDGWAFGPCERSDSAGRSGGAESRHSSDMRARWYDPTVFGGITGMTYLLLSDEYLQ